MRFGLKCVIALAILYRAILLSQGGAETAALGARLAATAPTTPAQLRDAIASRVEGYCRGDPAGCLADAGRLTSLVAAAAADDPAPPRHPRPGAVAPIAR